jgi:hypothetical protein
MPTIEPACNLFGGSWLGFEGGDAVGDTFIIDLGNRLGINQRGGARGAIHGAGCQWVHIKLAPHKRVPQKGIEPNRPPPD